MRRVLFLMLALLPISHATGQAEPASAADVTQPKPSPKFKRRVLLTVFLNEHHDKEKEYLAASIPDAFSAPLLETENFVMLNRTSVFRYLKAMGITPREAHDEDNAVGLGRAIGADVVLIGKFSNVGDEILIEAKAVDVQAGRISVETKEQVKVNSNMFDAINQMAKQMSAPMAEKMKPMDSPPPPAEIVLTEEEVSEQIKQSEVKKGVFVKEFPFAISLGFAIENSLGANNSVFPTGFGGIISGQTYGLSKYVSKRSWLKPVELGFMAGYLAFSAQDSAIQTLTQVPLYLTFGYYLSFDALRALRLTPLLAAGAHVGRFSSSTTSVTYFLPAFGAGGRIDFILFQRWRIGYTFMGVAELDQGANLLLLHALSAGVLF